MYQVKSFIYNCGLGFKNRKTSFFLKKSTPITHGCEQLFTYLVCYSILAKNVNLKLVAYCLTYVSPSNAQSNNGFRCQSLKPKYHFYTKA